MIIHGTITCQRFQAISTLFDHACIYLQSICLSNYYV